MVTDGELQAVLERARKSGAVTVTSYVGGRIEWVEVRNLPGVGPGRMPPIQAAETVRAALLRGNR